MQKEFNKTVISIRPLHERDIPDMCRIVQDPEIQALSLFVKAKERGEDVETTFRNLVRIHENGRYRSFAVLDGERCVGYVMSVSSERQPQEYWLGCWVDKSERGKSIALKALRMLMENLRMADGEKGLKSVFHGAISETNISSLRLAEKLGFTEVPADPRAPAAVKPMRHFIS